MDFRPTAFDIETGGIDNDNITRIGVATDDQCWTDQWSWDAKLNLNRAFKQPGHKVAFNIGFDAPRLALHGCEVPEPWWDVMLAAAVCEPDLKKALGFVAPLYLDIEPWKHLSEEDPAKYNALDTIYTLRLYHILREELQRTGQLALFEQRMMPSLPVLVEMTQWGIKVDKEAQTQWVGELTSKLNEHYAKWNSLAPGIKTSGSGLNNFLYGPLGLPHQYHKHGGETSELSALKRLLMSETLSIQQRTIIETLLSLRSVQKELKTYAEVELSEDGCIHPSFLPASKDDDSFGKGIAGTGRITASHPNIQNQPPRARRMYIPHGRGMVLLEADFSQIEARIIAKLADDPVLQAAIDSGLHDSNMVALGVDRTRAKNGFYGWAYGSGKRTLHNTFIARGFDVSERECEQLLRGFDRRFVRTTEWRNRIAGEVEARLYLTNVFGRRRYFFGGASDVPAALDFHPQSGAADIGWSVLRPLRDHLQEYAARLLAWNHDAVLVECPADVLRPVSEAVRSIMEQPWPELGGLSVPVSLKTGNNWMQMEPYDTLAEAGQH